MISKRVIGQPIPQQILTQAFKKGRLASTYLFYGPSGVGKFLLAWELAKVLLCEEKPNPDSSCGKCLSCLKIDTLHHPDFHLLFPHPSSDKAKEQEEFSEHYRQTKIKEPYRMVEYSRPVNIAIEKVRSLKDQIFRKPYQSDKKIVIIDQAESMRIDSFNALLKIFEEPPVDTVIILSTSQIDRIIPTVVSRSQKIRFGPLEQEAVKAQLEKKLGLTADKAGYYASLSEGSLGNALNLASGKWEETLELSFLLWRSLWEKKTGQIQEIIDFFQLQKDRSQILLLFKMWQHYLREVYLCCEGIKPRLPAVYEPNEEIYSKIKYHPSRIWSAFQILTQARLDFYRNIGIKSILVWLCLALPETLGSD